MNKLLILLAAISLMGCGSSQHDKISTPTLTDLDTGLMNEEPVIFSDVLEKVIEPNCVFCHGSYTNYQSVSQDSLTILKRIKGEGSGSLMPLGGPPLSDDLILLFETWVAQGAEEF